MKNRPQTAPPSSLKKIGRMIVIVVIIGLLVNIALAFGFGFRNTSEALRRVSWEHVLVPFAIYILIYVVDSLRLAIVLRQFGRRVRFVDAFVNSLMGYFLSYLTPMATGGQPFQIYHLKRIGIDAKTSTNVIVSRWIEYLVSAVVLTLAFFPLVLPLLTVANAQTTFLIIGFSASVAASVVVVILFIRPDWIGRILKSLEHSPPGRLVTRLIKRENWGRAAHAWSRDLRANIAFLWKEKFYIVALDLVLGVLVLGLQVFSLTWILVMLLGAKLAFIQVFVTVLLLNLVVYYIPTPGASGGLEGVYTMVFSLYTGEPQLSFVSVTVWRFATYYLQIFFGLVVFLVMRRRGGPLAEARERSAAKNERAPGGRSSDETNR
ncbi:MAG: flippase-like domain-containing protein [Spirochaetales bacterium]|nr:flippase-like domain-containing protein [Spirochaetales bacterium]